MPCPPRQSDDKLANLQVELIASQRPIEGRRENWTGSNGSWRRRQSRRRGDRRTLGFRLFLRRWSPLPAGRGKEGGAGAGEVYFPGGEDWQQAISERDEDET